MGIVACGMSLAFLTASIIFRKKDKMISPTIFFFALWTFILFLSVLNLYDISKPTNEAYLLIILMLVFFYLGSLIDRISKSELVKSKIGNISFVKERQRKDKKNVKYKLMIKVFYALGLCIIIFNIADIIIIIKEAIKGTPMWQIRNWTLEPYGSSNPILDRRNFIEDAFRSIILSPFTTIIYPIATYYLFNSKNKKERIGLMAISILVLITSSFAGGGGRLGFIYFAGCLILSFLVALKNKKISKDNIKKYKKIMLCVIIVSLIFIAVYTTIRAGKGKIIKQVYTYFALPPTLLSIWLPDIQSTEFTYGMTTFFGVHSYFFRALDTIGLDALIPEVYNRAYTNITNAEIFKNVGYGVGNAFVTPIYYFLLDGGYPFVCIFSCFFGYIVSRYYDKFSNNINEKSFTIYVLMMYGVFLTFMRIQTAIPSYIISFIFVAIVFRPLKQDCKCKNDYSKDEGVNNQNDKHNSSSI